MEFRRCYGCMEEITAYPCPHCGYHPQNDAHRDYALRPGSILNGKYLVGRMLGQGGFGITYVGWDLVLGRKVAIKEYYPSGQVVRQNGATLQWYETQQAKTARESGKELFLKEARKMSKVSGISQVVQVHDLFLANETAYIVMEFIEGETLKQRLQKTGPLSWQDMQKIFLPVTQAMEQVHQAGLIHRDLSPDNLMLLPDGDVKVLDLGAAKDLSVNAGVSSMQVAKGGFSPLEQYTQRGGSGTWTDVYALGATIYYTLTGVVPPAAMDRMERDEMNWELEQLRSVPRAGLRALKKAMAVRASDRTQTMQELYQGIAAKPPAGKAAKAAPKPAAPPKPKADAAPARKRTWKLLLPMGAVLACAVLAAAFLLRGSQPKAEAPASLRGTTPATQPTAAPPSPEELSYNQAAEWEADGQLGRAAIAFGQLGDYRDANARSFAIWEKITDHNTFLLSTPCAAIKADGTVAVSSEYPELEQAVRGWTDIVALESIPRWIDGEYCVTALGLKSDGTVVTASSMPGFDFPDVDGWTQIIDVCSGYGYAVSLRSDGTVAATGDNTYGQCDVEDWRGIVAIETSNGYTVGLRYDGTVVAAGCLGWEGPDVRPYVSGWTDIAAVETAWNTIIGRKTDGTMVCSGLDCSWIEAVLEESGWTDVQEFFCTDTSLLALKTDGTVAAAGRTNDGANIPFENSYGRLNVSEWTDIVAVSGDDFYSVGLKADGTVVTAGLNRHGRCHVTDWTDIAAVWADYDFTLGLKSDGTFVLAGQVIDYNNQKNPIRELLQWENIRIPAKPLPARNGHESQIESGQ